MKLLSFTLVLICFSCSVNNKKDQNIGFVVEYLYTKYDLENKTYSSEGITDKFKINFNLSKDNITSVRLN